MVTLAKNLGSLLLTIQYGYYYIGLLFAIIMGVNRLFWGVREFEVESKRPQIWSFFCILVFHTPKWPDWGWLWKYKSFQGYRQYWWCPKISTQNFHFGTRKFAITCVQSPPSNGWPKGLKAQNWCFFCVT